jgi:hypothetical protein
MTPTSELVDWIVGVSYTDFNDETVHYTKKFLLNTIAGMLAGSREPG